MPEYAAGGILLPPPDDTFAWKLPAGNHASLIARIDQLITEEKCPHCARDWHSKPLTSAVLHMYETGRTDPTYFAGRDHSPIVCDGSAFIGPLRPYPSWWYPRRREVNAQIAVVPDFNPFLKAQTHIGAIFDEMVAIWPELKSDLSINVKTWLWEAEPKPKCDVDPDASLGHGSADTTSGTTSTATATAAARAATPTSAHPTHRSRCGRWRQPPDLHILRTAVSTPMP